MAREPTALDKLRDRLRRGMFIVCMGFGAYVAGSILTFQLFNRLSSRLSGSGAITRFVVSTLVGELWAMAVFPLFCYGAARIIELRPWTTAIAGILTGQVFGFAVQVISVGLDMPWRFILAQGVGVGVGVFASAQAVKRGRAAALRGDEAARKAAEARKGEYDEFMRAAERTADRVEANAAAAAAPAPAPEAPPSPPAPEKPS